MSQEDTLSEWRAFVEQHPLNGKVGDAVVCAWRRSLAAGVQADADDPEPRQVTRAELSRRVKSQRELTAVARSHLQWMSAALGSLQHVIYLSDPDGIVMLAYGDAWFIASGKVAPGYDRSERQVGSNGAGTALATGEAAVLVGTEHYARAFHGNVCVGVPIYAPDGAIAGAVALRTYVEDGDPARLALVSHLAFAIQNELAQRESELQRRHLQAALESSEEAIGSVTLDGDILSWNTGAERLLGYAAREMIGCNVSRLRAESSAESQTSVFSRLRQGETVESFEGRLRCKDGSVVTISARLAPIRSEAGALIGATAVGHAIDRDDATMGAMDQALDSGRAEQRERLRIAQFLHGHLQQILVAAQIQTELLKGRATDNEQQTVNALSNMLEDAQEGVRGLSHELDPQVLYELGLAAALEWLAERARENYGFSMHVDIDQNVEPACVEVAELLFHSVRELLLNAAKHSGSPDVWLRMDQDERSGRLRVEVEDAGNGFDPKRVDREEGGKQLGLFAMDDRLERVGGAAHIEAAPGSGTRVTLFAPPPPPGRCGGRLRDKKGRVEGHSRGSPTDPRAVGGRPRHCSAGRGRLIGRRAGPQGHR